MIKYWSKSCSLFSKQSSYQIKYSIRDFTPSEKRFDICFFGTDSIAKNVLQILAENQKSTSNFSFVNNVEAVVPQVISKKKKDHPVQSYCLQEKIKMHQPLSGNKETRKQDWTNFRDYLMNREEKLNFGVVCSFGYMIPEQIIDCFSDGKKYVVLEQLRKQYGYSWLKMKDSMVVIHPSLLPRYRGASPIQQTLLNGDEHAGVSIVEISKGKFDAGKILIQTRMDVPATARYTELAEELSIQGGNGVLNLLKDFDYYKKTALDQDKSPYEASKAPKFELEDTVINWEEQTNSQVYNHYRSLYGTNFKTVKTEFKDTMYFIDEMNIVTKDSEAGKILHHKFEKNKPGEISVLRPKQLKNSLFVKCKDGWVEIKSGYLQTKQVQPCFKFINQYINREDLEQKKQSYHFGKSH